MLKKQQAKKQTLKINIGPASHNDVGTTVHGIPNGKFR